MKISNRLYTNQRKQILQKDPEWTFPFLEFRIRGFQTTTAMIDIQSTDGYLIDRVMNQASVAGTLTM